MDNLAKENAALEAFKSLFEQLNASTVDSGIIEKVYAENMCFEDSFHSFHDRAGFIDYCRELYKNVREVRFDFHDQFVGPQQAMLTWTMHYRHPRLNGGKMITVEGASHLRIDDKVTYHRDYFDGGELLYEHIPLLSSIIKGLKRRLAS